MDCKLALSGVSTELRTDRDKLHSGREVRTYAGSCEKSSSSVMKAFFLPVILFCWDLHTETVEDRREDAPVGTAHFLCGILWPL